MSTALTAVTVELADEDVDAWRVAVDAAGLIQAHFPAFFAEHVAGRPATLEGGLGATCAFFRLVEVEKGLDLRWPSADIWRHGPSLKDECVAMTPEEWLTTFNGVSEEYLASIGYWLFDPRPVYHGWDVQSHLGGEGGAPGQLTALLWQLMADTSLSVGRPDTIAQACSLWDEDDRIDILRIPPVPACDGGRLLALVARDIPEARGLADPAQLLRYPLGATGNPLADVGELDLDVVHEGEDVEVWDWSSMDDLAAQQRQAQDLSERFVAWRDRVEAGRLPALRQVARQFHRAARLLASEPPPTLIDILVGTPAAADLEELEEVTL